MCICYVTLGPGLIDDTAIDQYVDYQANCFLAPEHHLNLQKSGLCLSVAERTRGQLGHIFEFPSQHVDSVDFGVVFVALDELVTCKIE